MRSLSNLIHWTEPSAVLLQSSVLIVFFASFIFLVVKLSSEKSKELCDKISTQFFAD